MVQCEGWGVPFYLTHQLKNTHLFNCSICILYTIIKLLKRTKQLFTDNQKFINGNLLKSSCDKNFKKILYTSSKYLFQIKTSFLSPKIEICLNFSIFLYLTSLNIRMQNEIAISDKVAKPVANNQGTNRLGAT